MKSCTRIDDGTGSGETSTTPVPKPYAGKGLSGRQFPPTSWTLIRGRDLEELCNIYWPAVYAFLRFDGHGPHDAEDFAQGFFHKIFIGKNLATRATPANGRFRTFLIRCLKNYVSNEIAKQQAAKRGGKRAHVSVHSPEGELILESLPSDTMKPDEVFDWVFAQQLIDQVFAALEAQYRTKGQLRKYKELLPFLAHEGHRGDYAKVARRLRMSEGALRKAVHDLRHRYQSLLRSEIACVARPHQVDAEGRHLHSVSHRTWATSEVRRISPS
jgi:RNA polymerase sigma factor (sigma-70 family)